MDSVTQLSSVMRALAGKEKSFQAEQIAVLGDTLTDIAEHLESIGPKHNAKGQQLREALAQTLKLNAEVTAHVDALDDARRRLQQSTEATDFEAQLAEGMAASQEAAQRRYDPDTDEAMRKFDHTIWAVHKVGPPPGAENEDEELQIGEATNDNIAPNAACPISMTSVWDIEEPIEDVKGYVYEKRAILQHIRQNKDRDGNVECPVAMTAHTICANALKPARHLIKAQKKRRRQQELGTQVPNIQQGDVLDID